jgi:Tol biopolymer transport system component
MMSSDGAVIGLDGGATGSDGATGSSGNARMITALPHSAFVPSWSPDGASMAFVVEAQPRVNIFQIDSNGSNLRRLSAGPTYDERPAFSPDGSKIAFQSNRDGNYEIYVMSVR